MKLRIETLPIDRINPSPYNPRKKLKKSDPAYKKLKNSLDTFGYVDPLIWNEKTGNLVGGHQRFQILQDCGVKEVQVSVVSLSESEEKALNIALNRIEGEWDNVSLAQVLQSLEEEEFDWQVTGFELNEFDDLMKELEKHEKETGAFLDDLANPSPLSTNPTSPAISQPVTVEPSRSIQNQPVQKEPTESPTDSTSTTTVSLYTRFILPVTSDEQQVLYRAIRLAKQHFESATSTEAMVAICNRFIQEVQK